MIRIGGGKLRGKKIEVPSYLEVPTKEVVRLAMMNALQGVLLNSKVLDLCAGSGALGIESLSRGAKEATFIEKEEEGVRTILKNLVSCRLSPQKVLKMDAETFCQKVEEQFNLIFFDPPYKERELYSRIYSLIVNRSLLVDGGLFILEYEGNFPLSVPIKKEYSHGRTKFAIIRKE